MKTMILLFAVCAEVLAQSQVDKFFKLVNGARVLYQIQSEGSPEESGEAVAAGDHIQRTMTSHGQHWLGFSLRVERLVGANDFRVSLEPLPDWPYFAAPPQPREIHAGDRVMLDVLEQPGTGKKMFDTFQVGFENTPMQVFPIPPGIPEMPVSGAILTLKRPRLMQLGTASGEYSSDSLIANGTVALQMPGKGRFIFSSSPLKGFRMEGAARENAISFVIGGEQYQVISSVPVFETSGIRYVWVKLEPEATESSYVTLGLTRR